MCLSRKEGSVCKRKLLNLSISFWQLQVNWSAEELLTVLNIINVQLFYIRKTKLVKQVNTLFLFIILDIMMFFCLQTWHVIFKADIDVLIKDRTIFLQIQDVSWLGPEICLLHHNWKKTSCFSSFIVNVIFRKHILLLLYLIQNGFSEYCTCRYSTVTSIEECYWKGDFDSAKFNKKKL